MDDGPGGGFTTSTLDDPAARPGLVALALELGWHDQSHFTRDLRRITGPPQYADGRFAS